MAIDLKPVSQEIIQSMGYTSDVLWLVKVEDRVFGPFEVESLKHYAAENEHEFEHAQATLVNTDDWKPFFSLTHFQKILHAHQEEPEEAIEVFYWVLARGQKAGPFNKAAVDKKIEAGQFSMNDLASTDDGLSWKKFFHFEAFNLGKGTLPMAPRDSSFAKANEETSERVEHEDRSPTSQSNLAGLAFKGHKVERPEPKLEEMDLKSLDETELSRSMKWVIPSAVAGAVTLFALGNYLLSPSTDLPPEVAQSEEKKSEVILPKAAVSMPSPSMYPAARTPASYNMPSQRSRPALEQAPTMNHQAYPAEHIETHYNEPEPSYDHVGHSDQGQTPEQQEHSLVSNQNLPVPQEGESLDQAMSGQADPEMPAPELPVMQEAGDF